MSGARAADIIEQTKRQNSHFICHKAQIAGFDAACHGHHVLGIGQMSRIAERLGAVEWIDPVTLQPVAGPDDATASDLPPGCNLDHE